MKKPLECVLSVYSNSENAIRRDVQGDFFLRKKSLKLVLPVYSNSETAIVRASAANIYEQRCKPAPAV
jgi:hypothetical protein